MPPPTRAGGLSISPPARLLATLLLSVAIAASNGLYAALAALVCGLIVLIATHIPWRALRPRLLAVNIFLLCMWIIVPFTARLDHPGSFSASGAYLCLLITIKANAIMAIFTALLSPLSPFALGAALRKLRCPARLVWLFLLLERNVHILRRQWTVIFDAARLRAYAPGVSIHGYRTMAALLALWLYHAWEKSARLQEALLLRGYDGGIHFASTGDYPADRIFWPIVLTAVALLLYLNRVLP